MKILIISDVHGNYEALDAIQEEADLIWCLGDIVNYGPKPKECLDRVKSMAHKIVRGNHDNAIGLGLDCGCSLAYKALADAGKKFTQALLEKEDRRFLGALPVVEITEIQGASILLSHGSPRGDMYKYLPPKTTDEELQGELGGMDVDFVLIGHTHLPMLRKVNHTTILNPGSVGQPRDGSPLASYAVWQDGQVEIRRVQYDVEAAVMALKDTTLPPAHIDSLSRILLNGGI